MSIKYEHFREVCQGGGLKATSQRFVIYKTLESITTHPTADQLFDLVNEDLPGISRDTVYRTLNVLADRGLVRKVVMPGGATRFDGNPIPHHHFLCEKCNVIFDLNWPEFSALAWPATALELGSPHRASVLITGICRNCR